MKKPRTGMVVSVSRLVSNSEYSIPSAALIVCATLVRVRVRVGARVRVMVRVRVRVS